MQSKIKDLILKIEELNEALRKEHQAIADKYGYFVKRRKVIFNEAIKKKNKLFKVPAWKYAIPKRLRHILSMPFIYSMVIPAITMDFFISTYQFFAFPLYGIPKVKRRDFFVYDRRFLDYLNVIQKGHCLYCSYVNGLLGYASEIGARTERYWCPLKAATRPKYYHSWYKDFADFGDPEGWNCRFNDPKAFEKVKNSKIDSIV